MEIVALDPKNYFGLEKVGEMGLYVLRVIATTKCSSFPHPKLCQYVTMVLFPRFTNILFLSWYKHSRPINYRLGCIFGL